MKNSSKDFYLLIYIDIFITDIYYTLEPPIVPISWIYYIKVEEIIQRIINANIDHDNTCK